MPEKKVPDEAKPYIVSRLACFVSKSRLIKEVKEEWKITLTMAALAHYDPTTVQGRDLSKDLKQLFEEARAQYRAGVIDVGIANQRNRLERLDRIANYAEEEELPRLEMEAVKAAREEMAPVNRAAVGAENSDSPADGDAAPAGFKERVEELKQKTPQELADIYSTLIN